MPGSATDNGSPFSFPAGTITNASKLVFTPEDGGTYIFTLTATDHNGKSGSASTPKIIVNNVAPTASIAGLPARTRAPPERPST